MRYLDPRLEALLGDALGRWRRLRFSGFFAALLALAAGGALLLGLAVWHGLLRDLRWVLALAALLLLVSGLGLLIAIVAAAVARPSRSFLAGRLEEVHPALLDRLNTLVWLDAGGRAPDSYRRRIESQAGEEMAFEPRFPPFPTTSVRRGWGLSFLVLAATVAFHAYARPWTKLEWGPRSARASQAEPALDLPAPEDAAEVKPSWGEVRITEPGRDLKVTKVDVVPLQIEAASSDELRQAWYETALGSGKSQPKPLPPPPEPHYAVYKPVIYVDELRLAEWDVLSYHAAAGTRNGKTYASEVYFLEVRPFREDILKLPGGEDGAAYSFLSELTGLIDRQKHVIRETHAHLNRSHPTAAAEKQDRDKLAQAEADLAEAARHLYARIAARMENQDVAVVLDHLAQGEEKLEAAARAVAARDPAAAGLERDALAALVATRKRLQKAISDNPDAFGRDGETPDGEEREPVADLPGKLKQISEFRDEEKAARELLERALAEQRRQKEKSEKASGEERQKLAAEQERRRLELSDFAAAHPRLFQRAEKERAAADEAMRQAGEDLADPQADPGPAGGQAVAALEELRAAVRRRAAGKELEQAYQLKEMLDGQARALQKMEGAPETSDPAPTAGEAKQTTRELKRLIEDTPAGDAFGPALHQALGPGRQAERERKLDALAQAEGGAARKQAAGEARRALEQLSRSFEESHPQVVRNLRRGDALKDGPEEGFDRALRQLEGLAAEGEAGKSQRPEDAERRRREILLNLRQGAEGRYGQDERSARLLLLVEQELSKVDLKVDPKKLRKLLDEIEQFRLEMTERGLAARADPRLRHIDPSKLPPAYRDRIQKYFETLAEEP